MMETIARKRILVLYEYFYPGYKAGGPVQSLQNMILTLQHLYDFYVIANGYDLNDTAYYAGVVTDDWNEVVLAKDARPIQVWYASHKSPGIVQLKQIIEDIQPHKVYINGMFARSIIRYPLWLRKLGAIAADELIVSPRGMLQQGALATKAWKKKLYLTWMRTVGLFNKLHWHATTEDEAKDIVREFGQLQQIVVAGNIPRPPLPEVKGLAKHTGSLQLLYLSVITAKKQLLESLQAMVQVPAHCTIQLTIVGPVKEADYWAKCQAVIKQMPPNVQVAYAGDVHPQQVPSVMQQHHMLLLMSKGENFGHALFESMAVGRPIITSHHTPWNHLETRQAGWNLELHELPQMIEKMAMMDQASYDLYCTSAHRMATDYFSQQDFIQQYQHLFG
jgi:glycosyltransferase involved in cell wall biosynthesis